MPVGGTLLILLGSTMLVLKGGTLLVLMNRIHAFLGKATISSVCHFPVLPTSLAFESFCVLRSINWSY